MAGAGLRPCPRAHRRPTPRRGRRQAILARRAEGQSIREIAAAKVSVGVVHKTLNTAAAPVDG
ncbi:hypothetical protein [Streptomyces exfoliatus]|uniref:hypothetical protein n=1 Tax=Streptomyces exfoliatus TaxID=1905 RepID=UPI003C30333E